jgi:oligoendopeptidase F
MQEIEKNMLHNLPKWDLSSLYKSLDDAAIQKDLNDASQRVQRFQSVFEKKVTTLDGETLLGAITEYEAIEELLGRLSSYAYLVYAENISDATSSQFYQNISEKITDISSCILFFELELNQIDDSTLEALYSSSSDLRKYHSWLRDIRLMRPYQLSEGLEKLLHEKATTSQRSWHRLFEETMADLRFPFEKESLTCAEILNHLSSKNPEKREKAAKSIGETFKENAKIFAMITNTLAKDKAIDDKWRSFPKPISSRNVANCIEDHVTEALINTVKENYSATAHRYYKLKAKWFDVDALDYWDRNAPIPGDDGAVISWEQATETVLSAYEAFSPEMAKMGKRFFTENWIDAQVRDGKDSGAFSHPTVPSAHPYILMNFQGKTRDVMTLAHELGHGVHQMLSAEQGYFMSDTPLTLAETASVFGEQLTFRSLLNNEKDSKKKKALLAGKVEDMLNTVVRQVAFCEFERQVHDERKKGEVPLQRICDIWMQIQKESLGDGVRFDGEYQYYWMYIPHFIHTPFYVYAYAFGDCLVNSLYQSYLDQPVGFEARYIEMLRAGGTLHHRELLAPFGLDASKSDFWQGGLNMLIGFIDELEKL